MYCSSLSPSTFLIDFVRFIDCKFSTLGADAIGLALAGSWPGRGRVLNDGDLVSTPSVLALLAWLVFDDTDPLLLGIMSVFPAFYMRDRKFTLCPF
jgi:hypothetical protein